MKYNPKEIISFIKKKVDYPLKMKELAKALQISSADYAQFRKTVKSLINTGELVKLKRGRIGLASELNVKVGVISITRGGAGYLITEGEEDDIYIPPPQLLTALDGDTVMVRLNGYYGEKRKGAVIKIIKRTERNIVGTFHKSQHFNFVIPDNKKIHRDIYIPSPDTLKAKEGEKVVTHITAWEDPYLNPEGNITERLGFPEQPGVDMLTVIKNHNLPEKFPDNVLQEAEKVAIKLPEAEIKKRLDLTAQNVCTIDPADAKDHDDAIFVEKLPDGYRLFVHIADVSHYVKEGSAMDKEAFVRGNSVYLPGKVIPMLPQLLSNDVCSLKVNRTRLAHSVIMTFDKKGKMIDWHRANTLIKSKAKLSYEEVQKFFDTDEMTSNLKKVAKSLIVARELAHLLNRKRFREGSLDFDLPESMIILNKNGEVIELGNKVRLEAHRLVEEFMLAANRAVALEVFRDGQPFLYRVHDKPSLEKLKDFSSMMKYLGYSFPVSPQMKPKAFALFLKKIKDSPKADFINELLLRSMKKAVYQRHNIGHFGLAFNHYTHFTSPIRRYPDLLVHRLLRKLRNGKYPPAYAKKVDATIDHAGEHCSETERIAETAEREAIKVKQMSYMAKQIGNEFEGVISGIIPYGFFVRLNKMGVEGMVRISSIDNDYYVYNEKHYSITGRRTKQVFQLGDRVTVRVVQVNKIANEMDLMLINPQKHIPKNKKRLKRKKSEKQ